MGVPSDARHRRGVVLDQLEELVERTGMAVRLVDPGDDGGGLSVASITHDSRLVVTGGVFACLRGDRYDGHEFAGAAVESGAALLVVDHELPIDQV